MPAPPPHGKRRGRGVEFFGGSAFANLARSGSCPTSLAQYRAEKRRFPCEGAGAPVSTRAPTSREKQQRPLALPLPTQSGRYATAARA
jgi:hypothetical protein